MTFHQFWSDQGTKRGFELNGVFSRKVFKYFTLLHKVAWYQGQNKSSNTVGGGRPDRYRVWLEVTFALSI